MIRKDNEVLPLDKIPEVTNTFMNGEKFPVKSRIARLGRLKGAAEKAQRTPNSSKTLLQNAPDGGVGRVHCQSCLSTVNWMMEKRSSG